MRLSSKTDKMDIKLTENQKLFRYQPRYERQWSEYEQKWLGEEYTNRILPMDWDIFHQKPRRVEQWAVTRQNFYYPNLRIMQQRHYAAWIKLKLDLQLYIFSLISIPFADFMVEELTNIQAALRRLFDVHEYLENGVDKSDIYPIILPDLQCAMSKKNLLNHLPEGVEIKKWYDNLYINSNKQIHEFWKFPPNDLTFQEYRKQQDSKYGDFCRHKINIGIGAETQIRSKAVQFDTWFIDCDRKCEHWNEQEYITQNVDKQSEDEKPVTRRMFARLKPNYAQIPDFSIYGCLNCKKMLEGTQYKGDVANIIKSANTMLLNYIPTGTVSVKTMIELPDLDNWQIEITNREYEALFKSDDESGQQEIDEIVNEIIEEEKFCEPPKRKIYQSEIFSQAAIEDEQIQANYSQFIKK